MGAVADASSGKVLILGVLFLLILDVRNDSYRGWYICLSHLLVFSFSLSVVCRLPFAVAVGGGGGGKGTSTALSQSWTG